MLEGDRSFDLLVRYNDTTAGASKKSHTPFRHPGRGEGADPRTGDGDFGTGANTISRENVQRKIVVQANVAGRDLRSVIEEIRVRVGHPSLSPRVITSNTAGNSRASDGRHA